MIPGAGKSPSCFKKKSQVMRQHRESCTIDQQQEAHSLCLKKKQKTPKKEPAGSSSGTLLTAGRFFTEESSGGAALCRVQALLGCARSLVWENQGENEGKNGGKLGNLVLVFPKGPGCWVLQHTPAPQHFPAMSCFIWRGRHQGTLKVFCYSRYRKEEDD